VGISASRLSGRLFYHPWFLYYLPPGPHGKRRLALDTPPPGEYFVARWVLFPRCEGTRSMANNVNFFTWIREGVKQAVLLGVSDAVQEIGAPENDEDMSRRLLDVIKNDGATSTAIAGRTAAPGRKRLGRSLKDIEETVEKK
jgi:hypothetical protein